MEYKYLSDGRKVVVIGQLNNVESIVQEVFVTEGGDQVPSGEKFTTKSLHDEPVKSWKEKKEQEWDARVEASKKQYEGIEGDISTIRIKQKGLTELFRQSSLLLENIEDQELDTLTAVMSGACEWLVIASYGHPTLVSFEDEMINTDRNWSSRSSYDGIKLITLMGKADGSLAYHVNRYYDGSGSNTRVYPFVNKDDAIKKVKEIVLETIGDNRFPSLSEYKTLLALGISFNKKITARIKNRLMPNKKERLAKIEKTRAGELKKLEGEVSEVDTVFPPN